MVGLLFGVSTSSCTCTHTQAETRPIIPKGLTSGLQVQLSVNCSYPEPPSSGAFRGFGKHQDLHKAPFTESLLIKILAGGSRYPQNRSWV